MNLCVLYLCARMYVSTYVLSMCGHACISVCYIYVHACFYVCCVYVRACMHLSVLYLCARIYVSMYVVPMCGASWVRKNGNPSM